MDKLKMVFQLSDDLYIVCGSEWEERVYNTIHTSSKQEHVCYFSAIDKQKVIERLVKITGG